MCTRRHRRVRGDVIRGAYLSDGGAASSRARLLVVALLAFVLSLPAFAQGPEGYGVPHLFALPTATTARQFGMGGVTTCIEDIGFANPAFAGMLEGQRAGVRVSCTDFDGGLNLTATQMWYATPISANAGVQIIGLNLDSDRGGIMTAAGPLAGGIEETDLGFHYGQRLSDTWLVGAGLSPLLDTESRLVNPVTGDLISFSESEATLGARIGSLYQWGEDAFVGFVFDYYTEDVTFMAPPMQAPAEFEFTSTEWALGVSGRLAENVIGAIEWLQLHSEDRDFEATSEGLHLGLEVAPMPGVALRAGSNDGAISLGAGYSQGGWVANYAYVKDWNDDEVGAAFGGSDTHQLEVGTYW